MGGGRPTPASAETPWIHHCATVLADAFVSIAYRSWPDRPGGAGSLAVALGSVGADILARRGRRGNNYAIDDLVVDCPERADTLITAAEA